MFQPGDQVEYVDGHVYRVLDVFDSTDHSPAAVIIGRTVWNSRTGCGEEVIGTTPGQLRLVRAVSERAVH